MLQQSNFKRIALNYWHNVEALSEIRIMYAPGTVPKWVKDMVHAIGSVARAFGTTDDEGVARLDQLVQAMESQGDELMKTTASLLPAQDQPMTHDEFLEKMKGHEAVIPHIRQAANSLVVLDRTRGLLERSVLVMLVSSFEVLLADIFHEYFRLVPAALSSDDKALSVNELKRFETIEEALLHVAADRVGDLLRGDPDRWAKELYRRFNVDIKSAVPVSWHEFLEMFQRRHLYVHNDGRVDAGYLTRSRLSLPQSADTMPPSLGDYLNTTEEYVNKVINTFTVTGMALVDRIWSKLVDSEVEDQDQVLSEVVHKALETGDKTLVIGVCTAGLQRRCSTPEWEHFFRLNRWYAFKALGQWADVEAEVKSFDCSRCSPTTALCVWALLDDEQRVIDQLEKVCELGFSVEILMTWPILATMKVSPEFEEKVALILAGKGDSALR